MKCRECGGSGLYLGLGTLPPETCATCGGCGHDTDGSEDWTAPDGSFYNPFYERVLDSPTSDRPPKLERERARPWRDSNVVWVPRDPVAFEQTMVSIRELIAGLKADRLRRQEQFDLVIDAKDL